MSLCDGALRNAADSESVRGWRMADGAAIMNADAFRDRRRAEVHWYEAHGVGRKEVKRKRYVD